MSEIIVTKAMKAKDGVRFLKNTGMFNDHRRFCALCKKPWETSESDMWNMEIKMKVGYVALIGSCCTSCADEIDNQQPQREG